MVVPILKTKQNLQQLPVCGPVVQDVDVDLSKMDWPSECEWILMKTKDKKQHTQKHTFIWLGYLKQNQSADEWRL